MAEVHFTSALQRHLDCPTRNAHGETVREALENVFASHPALRGYVLDDQGGLRHHVNVFVDGEQVTDRTDLSHPVLASSRIDVMQALSGG